MKHLLALAPAAAAVMALALVPAMATPKKNDRAYAQSGQQGAKSGPNGGFVFADPSFGNRAGIDYARSTGRCVIDLGYGRFEYCGW